MRPVLPLLGTLVLLPAMLGPLKVEARSLLAPLCGGGAVAIPFAPTDTPPAPMQGPCCAKGCQSGASRKRLDRSQ